MVTRPVDEAPLLLGMGSPQQEDHPLAVGVDPLYDPVGEGFPAQMGMGVGHARLHRQHRIEQQHPLGGPGLQEAVTGCDKTRQIPLHLLVDVDQGGRRAHPGQHGEAEAVGLIRPVIGVLSQDHHLDTVQLGQLEGIEHLGGRGVNHLARFPLLPDGRQGCLEIVLLFLRTDHILPGQHASLLSL